MEVLQILLENFQDPGFMQRLDRARTEDEYVAALATMAGLDAWSAPSHPLRPRPARPGPHPLQNPNPTPPFGKGASR